MNAVLTAPISSHLNLPSTGRLGSLCLHLQSPVGDGHSKGDSRGWNSTTVAYRASAITSSAPNSA
jgi:hypothetical protein